MAITYEPIATTTLSTATASVTFSSISGSYTDLVLVLYGNMSASGNSIYMRFNGDTGSNYSVTYVGAAASGAYSARSTNNSQGAGIGGFYVGYTNGLYSCITHILNYSNSTTYKTLLTRWGDPSTGGSTEALVNLWRNTAAITSLEVRNSSGGTQNFASGSTFTLYGIKSA